MDEQERDTLRGQLLACRGVSDETVEIEINHYEERESEKSHMIEIRGASNAIAESFLDKSGYKRPRGWHSVFFYPGSNRVRNKNVFFAITIAAVAWVVAV